jgi:methionyl-tRNA formyltransferase
MKIVFMGTPDFAVASLSALLDADFDIVGVITAPDKPAGRGQKISESAVKRFAVEKGLKVLQPVKLKDPGFSK